MIVVGAGAGGMMAAGRAAERGAKVLLLEKTDGPGKKILISGKSRCNLTNTRDLDDFISMYGPNGRFLHGAFRRFFRDDLLAFLGRYGVETKVERGGRIFPVSDDAADVVQGLPALSEGSTRAICGPALPVTGIAVRDGRVEGVRTEKGPLPARAVILATGGATWPATGSTGDGYRMAAALGHTVTKLRPALVPLVVAEVERAKAMQGVSLRNVRLTAFRGAAADHRSRPDPGEGSRPRARHEKAALSGHREPDGGDALHPLRDRRADHAPDEPCRRGCPGGGAGQRLDRPEARPDVGRAPRPPPAATSTGSASGVFAISWRASFPKR